MRRSGSAAAVVVLLVALEAKRYDEALAKFQEVIKRDPASWPAYRHASGERPPGARQGVLAERPAWRGAGRTRPHAS